MSEAPSVDHPAKRQVSVAEAAALLGVSVDTIKRRVRSGALHSSRTAQGRVSVTVPGEEPAPQPSGSAPQEPNPAPQAAPHVQGNDDELAALYERVTAVTTERDWLRDRVERAESEREQLRILLGTAQQSLVRALQAAPQHTPEPPQEARTEPAATITATDAPFASTGRWWLRWALALFGAILLAGVLLGWPR